jgi:hypothetical protein
MPGPSFALQYLHNPSFALQYLHNPSFALQYLHNPSFALQYLHNPPYVQNPEVQHRYKLESTALKYCALSTKPGESWCHATGLTCDTSHTGHLVHEQLHGSGWPFRDHAAAPPAAGQMDGSQ